MEVKQMNGEQHLRILEYLDKQATKNPMAASYDVSMSVDGRPLVMRIQPLRKRRLAVLQVVAYDYPRKGAYRIFSNGTLLAAALTLFLMRFHDESI